MEFVYTLLWQSPIQTVNANPLKCAYARPVYSKNKLNALNMYVHCLNKLYIALNDSNVAFI
jgi:hypothetical protein